MEEKTRGRRGGDPTKPAITEPVTAENTRNKASEEPRLRIRVRRQILDLIHSMNLSFSTKLPSEHELAESLAVSRTTVRAVLADLESEGKIVRRHGSGTYVNPAVMPVVSTLYPRMGMYDLIRSNGYTTHVEVLFSRLVVAGWKGPKINLTHSDMIMENHSVYYAGDRPCIYCIDYYDPKLFPELNWKGQEKAPGTVFDYIRKSTKVDIRGDIVQIVPSDSREMPELKKWFDIPKDEERLLICLEIVNIDHNNTPVLFGMIYIDTSIIQLHIIRTEPKP